MGRRIVLAVVALAMAGCSSGGDGAAPSTTGPTTSPTTGAVPAALEFRAPTVGGGTFDARSYAGETLALWFWAPY